MLRFFLMFVALAAAFAVSPEDRALGLKQKLMAPCCWSEAVAAHNSPAAQEMRAEIDRLVAAGVPDSEILAKFKAQYGARVLAEPDGSAGVWLTAIPVAITALGAFWVLLLLWRWRRREVSSTPSLPSVPEVR